MRDREGREDQAHAYGTASPRESIPLTAYAAYVKPPGVDNRIMGRRKKAAMVGGLFVAYIGLDKEREHVSALQGTTKSTPATAPRIYIRGASRQTSVETINICVLLAILAYTQSLDPLVASPRYPRGQREYINDYQLRV